MKLDNFNLTDSIDPSSHLINKEFCEAMFSVGSYISMRENRKINIATLFHLLFQNEHYKNVFMQLTSSSSFREGVLRLFYLYPSLLKAKKTKKLIFFKK